MFRNIIALIKSITTRKVVPTPLKYMSNAAMLREMKGMYDETIEEACIRVRNSQSKLTNGE
jgi:hypothetical protein